MKDPGPGAGLSTVQPSRDGDFLVLNAWNRNRCKVLIGTKKLHGIVACVPGNTASGGRPVGITVKHGFIVCVAKIIRNGDVIVRAGGRPVNEPGDVVAAVNETNAADRDTVLLLVNRQGGQHFVAVRIS